MAVLKPENVKKLFNLHHSSFRNVLESIFKVDKRRFKIINSLSEYNLKTQINLIFTLTCLHNFIKHHLSQDINYFKDKNKNLVLQSGGSNNLLFCNFLVTFTKMNEKKMRLLMSCG